MWVVICGSVLVADGMVCACCRLLGCVWGLTVHDGLGCCDTGLTVLEVSGLVCGGL